MAYDLSYPCAVGQKCAQDAASLQLLRHKFSRQILYGSGELANYVNHQPRGYAAFSQTENFVSLTTTRQQIDTAYFLDFLAHLVTEFG